MIKKFFKYALHAETKKFLKEWYYSGLDVWDFLRGRRNKNYPPRRLNFVGSADFENIGNEFKNLFIKLGGLSPDDRVLDIGCGVGRMAVPLATYLGDKGGYVGFDIVKKGIDWCNKNIGSRNPKFKFTHANISNRFYNSRGTEQSEEYVFPAQDSHFSFCFATSVFTHMLPAEVDHYIKESTRVLQKGGRAFFTFFLVPDEGAASYKTGFVNFQYRLDNLAYYSHKDCIEAEVGYPEKWVTKLMENSGFGDIKIYAGKWRDANGVSYQDIVVAQKK